ncbi:MAG: nucleotidyltransferase family protein [Elusimicrobia bacterium]|nr:nucleotidyltransferase family protein [Elusimicrobiota bacterium]
MSAVSEIPVVILCGGLGTRLRSVTGEHRPKPMADVGGKPFLEFLIDGAERQGFARFVLCVGHKAEVIRDFFDGRQDVAIEYSEEPEPLGTGGALKLASRLVDGHVFLAMNGDSYCPVDLAGLLNFHRAQRGAATLAVVDAGERRDGGLVDVSPAGRVVKFTEKAAPQGRAWLNAGIYAFERRVLDAIPAGACSLEKDVFPKLVPKGFYAFPSTKPLYDIGTPERLETFRAAMKGGLK